MNTTERLINSSKNRFTRELLRSAELDEAPDNTAAKIAFALGLGSTAVVTTVASSAAAATSIASGIGTTTAAAAAPAVSAVSAVGMLKVMAIVSLTCGTLSYGGVKLALKVTDKAAAVSTQVAARPAIASIAQTAPRAVASFAPEVAVNVPAPPADDDSDLAAAAPGQEQQQPEATEETSPRETNAPSVGRQYNNSNTAQIVANSPRSSANAAAESPTSPMPPPHAAMPATASFPGDDGHPAAGKGRTAPNLEREVAQLDHARAALVAGQPAIALREIDAYRVQNPRGMLAAESVVLRVRALLDMGFRSIAEREANPLLMSAPQSRHAERLRQILGVTSSTP